MTPRWHSLGVALLVAAAGLTALLLTDPAPSPALTLLGAVFALIFLARGALGFIPTWRRAHAVEPFAGLDRRVYSPLSLFIGAGFVILIVWRLL